MQEGFLCFSRAVSQLTLVQLSQKLLLPNLSETSGALAQLKQNYVQEALLSLVTGQSCLSETSVTTESFPVPSRLESRGSNPEPALESPGYIFKISKSCHHSWRCLYI